jgi:PRTRC genetic system protein C
MKIEALKRTFAYNAIALADPGAALTPAQVKDFYTAVYPGLTNAEIEGPKVEGNTHAYTFRRAVGTKGSEFVGKTDLTAFQLGAAAVALRKALYGSNHFSICDVDSLAKLLDRSVGGKDYQALHAMHCVHWGDMPPGMADEVRRKVVELLALPESILTPEPSATTAQPGEIVIMEPEVKRPRLAFWKRA